MTVVSEWSLYSPEEKQRRIIYLREWERRNPEKMKLYQERYKQSHPDKDRKVWLKRKYGLTPEQLDTIKVQQEDKCKICGESLVKGFHIDHDHKTNIVRGILCKNCNFMLGMFDENIELLNSAIAYLKNDQQGWFDGCGVYHPYDEDEIKRILARVK